jgi:hypothetical protein
MTEQQITDVAEVLAEWNPLGSQAERTPDLDGYRIEAMDIIATLGAPPRPGTLRQVVMDVLNQAFDLCLTEQDCAEAASRISAILILRKPK